MALSFPWQHECMHGAGAKANSSTGKSAFPSVEMTNYCLSATRNLAIS